MDTLKTDAKGLISILRKTKGDVYIYAPHVEAYVKANKRDLYEILKQDMIKHNVFQYFIDSTTLITSIFIG